MKKTNVIFIAVSVVLAVAFIISTVLSMTTTGALQLVAQQLNLIFAGCICITCLTGMTIHVVQQALGYDIEEEEF